VRPTARPTSSDERVTERERASLESLGTQVVHVAPAHALTGPRTVIDVDGSHGAYFADRGWGVAVTRPNFYAFGRDARHGERSVTVGDAQEVRDLVVGGRLRRASGPPWTAPI